MADGTYVYWAERSSGVVLTGFDAETAMLPVRYVSLTNTRWKRQSAESAYGHCGPTVIAGWSDREMTMSMSDFKSYFARFEELFVSEEESVAVKL